MTPVPGKPEKQSSDSLKEGLSKKLDNTQEPADASPAADSSTEAALRIQRRPVPAWVTVPVIVFGFE